MPADRVAVHGLISSQARVLKLARLFTAQAIHIAVTDAIDVKGGWVAGQYRRIVLPLLSRDITKG